MNLDDESLLTAYLDGELDAKQRLQVESALRMNPLLAEQLHQLAGVRDLIGGLARPALPVDLSRAFDAPTRLQRRPSLMALRPLAALGLGLSAAAALLLALSLGLRPVPRATPKAPVESSGRRAAQVTLHSPPANDRNPGSTDVEGPTAASVAPGPDQVPVVPSSSTSRTELADAEDELPPDRVRDQQRILSLLDSPNLHRVFIVTDVLGGNAGDRVSSLLQQTPRREPSFGRITIRQGIVIDPKHPNQAEVFALALSDDELPALQAKLNETFPNAVEETGVDPVVVTQLTEIGQVAVLPGSTTPDVVIPEATGLVARRDASKERRTPLEKGQVVDPLALDSPDPFERAHARAVLNGSSNVRGGSTLEPERSRRPRAALQAKDDPPPAAEEKQAPENPRAARTSIVLVWVTTRETHGQGP
jgi:hypothetical protein